MLRTLLKASSITHLTDARYFAAWEASWLGFHLSPGAAESVDVRLVTTLREWVDGVKICGEFGLASAEDIAATHELLQLDAVQVGMLSPSSALAGLKEQVEVIQEVVVEAYVEMDELEEFMTERADQVHYFLLNFSKGGLQYDDLKEGTPLNIVRLQSWAERFPLLIDLPLNDTTPSQFLTDIPVKGFAVQGGAEEKVGYKSFDELDDFFEDLEVFED